MKGYLFPGQGSQYVGMGKVLYHHSRSARQMFETADRILDMDLTQMMLEGSQEALKATAVAQPAIFLHSVVTAFVSDAFHPAAVAGHSLGEIAALVASEVIPFEDGLHLVAVRSKAMQKACQLCPGTMAAVLGLRDEVVEEICAKITQEIVVPANYNCPGQLVISGSQSGVALAVEALIKSGARKVIPLQVEGGFHSPLMAHAQESFAEVLSSIPFSKGICPIYQNVTGQPVTNPQTIKANLLQQLIAPVFWTKTICHMVEDGITECIECGPGTVLQGLTRKIAAALSIGAM
ncbi:ACP S-malonyltransferase [Cardinium endosymbiont of Oedothorax gibbosus]|uniref:ACP S-malonyltransferase n=1 Tax=Cardinium endosymbiont of Oedothorax gibbosus TaxID=931101 RepID=UPI0020253BF8|nr:ACP S-malonyltransferase [Cardinium endosymbiont of Oedothorax gibbosus]